MNYLDNFKFIYLMWLILRNFWLEKKSWKSKKLGLTHILHPKWKKLKSGQMIRTVLLFNPKLPTHTWMTSSLTSIKTMTKLLCQILLWWLVSNEPQKKNNSKKTRNENFFTKFQLKTAVLYFINGLMTSNNGSWIFSLSI